MTHADKILEFLYDRSAGYVLMGDLLAAAGLTRPQAQRALEQLRQRDYVIESSPTHGLRLARPVPLSAHLVERNLNTRRVGRNVISFPVVDSTNDVAFDAVGQRDSDGLAVLAESQRRGRGRMGRAWTSSPGANVLLSVLLHDPDARLPHEALTIAAGLAVAQGVQDACRLPCQLKWPNDVLLDGGKLAGILVEMRGAKGRRCFVVGIGINVNAAPPPEAVEAPASCLAGVLGTPVERIEVVRHVLCRLDQWTHSVEQGDTAALHAAWMSRCGMVNHRLAVVCGGRRYEGRVLDVDPLVGLRLCCDDGQTVHLPAQTSTVVK